MAGCCCPSSTSPFSPILFFATSTEANQTLTVGPETTLLTLGVSPSSPGAHQVKLDSTVELLITTGGGSIIQFNALYRLRRSDNVAPIATLTINQNIGIVPANPQTEIPNLTWNDTISNSITYTVTIQIIGTANIGAVTAQTRALNAIVF